MKRRRLWINLGLVLAIVIALIAIAVVALRPQEVAAPQRTATVEKTTVVATVTASGSVESAGDIDLNFGSTGTVTTVGVEPGDPVTKGQVLATIDQVSAQQQVAAARSNLAQALSSASTSSITVATAQQQLALAQQAAKASNESLKAAVSQAKANLAAAQSQWSEACADPDSAACPNPAAAEAVRTAQNSVKTAQLNYDKAVELATNNGIGYDLTVNHQAVQVQLAKTQAAKTCTDSGSDSSACLSANQAVTGEEQRYESALNTRKASVLADSQAVEKASMALSNAQVALKKTLADSSKAASDAVRTAQQALTNAESAYDKGRIANEQSVLNARNALTTAQSSLLPVETADGSAITAAEAGAESARAALAVAEQALADTSIIAPVDGTVASVNLTVGESSAGSLGSASSASSAAAITLIPTGAFTAKADFAESDASQIRFGDPAVVTFQALPGVTAKGSVLSIDPMAATSATDSLVTFTVTVSMEQVPETVRPGMTASIAITTDEIADVLAVPQAAITLAGDKASVEVLQPDNTSVLTPVTLGIKGDALTEITSGVREGQVVVIPTASDTDRFPAGGVPGGSPFRPNRG